MSWPICLREVENNSACSFCRQRPMHFDEEVFVAGELNGSLFVERSFLCEAALAVLQELGFLVSSEQPRQIQPAHTLLLVFIISILKNVLLSCKQLC